MKRKGQGRHAKFDNRFSKVSFLCLFIAFIGFVSSCTSSIANQLKGIELDIESNPQQALSELQSINLDSIRTSEDRARYALLLSMALDKNYIDKEEFDVLQPAIDYYSAKGDATGKLRMYYYQGRIYENTGDLESAMMCYSKALDHASGCRDRYCLSRVYGSQAVVYRSLFNLDRSVDCAMKAADIMKEIGDTTNYFLELNTIAYNLLVLDEKEKALAILDECDSLWKGKRYSIQRDYFGNRILFSRKYISLEESLQWVEKYLETIPEKHVNWIAITDAFYKAGDIEQAEKAMVNYDKYDGRISAGVEAMRAQILEAKGDYREALSHYRQYIHLSDSADLVAYRHNTRAVPELHELDMEREKMQRGRQIFAFSLVAVLLLLLLITVIYRQRNEMSRLKISQLEDEFEQLKELRQGEAMIDEEARTVLDERFELLNRFFKAFISKDGEEERKAYREIETLLSDRQRFATSTRKAFEASRPEFIRFLSEHGLDDKEINYCCLYALGLKGGEVGRYMHDSRHYHVSSEIRSKLGLGPNDTNLGLFLKSISQNSSQGELT